MPTQLPFDRLIADPAIHARGRVPSHKVGEYLQIAQEGGDFPAVTAFRDPADPDGRCWLADGFLRAYALERAGHETISVDLIDGDRRAALLFACGANAQHGQPRTQNDKWQSVVSLLAEPELAAQDDTWIAKTCAVSRSLVIQARQDCQTPETLIEARSRRHRVRQKIARQEAKRLAKVQEEVGEVQPDGTVALPEGPLTMREWTERLICRAERATRAALDALGEADRAYPEATRIGAAAAVSSARLYLMELMPVEELAKLAPPAEPGENEETLALLASWGMGEGLRGGLRIEDRGRKDGAEETQPATKRAEGLRIEDLGFREERQPATKRALTLVPSAQPATKRAPSGSQPATNLPSLDPRSSILNPSSERDLAEWTGGIEIETIYPSSWRQPATKRALSDPSPPSLVPSPQPATKRGPFDPGPRGPP